MVSRESKEWMAAGVKLATDPEAAASCPHCHSNNLKVRDFYKDSIKVESELYCDYCGSHNFVFYTSKEPMTLTDDKTE